MSRLYCMNAPNMQSYSTAVSSVCHLLKATEQQPANAQREAAIYMGSRIFAGKVVSAIPTEHSSHRSLFMQSSAPVRDCYDMSTCNVPN